MGSEWKTLGAAAPGELATAHFQPYQLAQWLARFARGYLAPVADDSHTSLQWRRDLGLMATGEAAVSGQRLALGLNPRDLSLATLVDGAVADKHSMHGVKDSDAGNWVRNRLIEFGLDPMALDAPSPYEIPPSPYANDASYDAKSHATALEELSRYYENVDLVLRDVVEKHRAIKPGPSQVRLWPHHFDIASIVTLEEGDFETARAVGFGLAIPDESQSEFYYYAYPWPRNARDDLPKLPADSAYQYDGKVGAIQLMSKIIATQDQEATARAFFDDMVELFIRLSRKDMKEE